MAKKTTKKQNELFYNYKFFPEEREVFRKKMLKPTSEWAEEGRYVTIGGHIGPWRNDISPHLNFIMDLAVKPYVRELVICKSPQTGGTEAILNCLVNEFTYSPAPVLIVQPTIMDARKFSEDRIIPMLKNSPATKNLISNNPDDTAKQRIKLNNGVIIYLGHSNSASALSSFPIRLLMFDEIDKYPRQIKQEAGPLSLGEKRTRTYPYTYKRFYISSPTREDGPIWTKLQECDVIYNFFACCPYCSHEQIYSANQLRFPKEKTPKEIEREKLATYECENEKCKKEWSELEKNLAMRTGQWKPVKGKKIKRPISPGVVQPAWVSPDVSLAEITAAYMLSKTNKIKSIDYSNDYEAKPYIESEDGEGVDYEPIYNRRYDYAPKKANWQIPMKVCFLTCAVDVQKDRIEAEVVGWGPGFESWGIEVRKFAGNPTVYPGQIWDDLRKFLNETEWTHESGTKLKVATTGIDSGYQAKQMVYKFIKRAQTPRTYAIKGQPTRGRALYDVSKATRGGKRVMDKYGINILNVGTETAKDTIYAWLQLEEPGAGFMHYPLKTEYDFEYFKQLTSEHLTTKYDKGGRPFYTWKKKHQDAPNEALDLRVYNLAVAEFLNPNFEKLKENLKPQSKENKDGGTKKEKPTKRIQKKKSFVRDF